MKNHFCQISPKVAEKLKMLCIHLLLFCLAMTSVDAAFINGPSRVCPGQSSVSFTAVDFPSSWSSWKFELTEPNAATWSSGDQYPSGTKTLGISFNSSLGTATIKLTINRVVGPDVIAYLNVSKSGAYPALANGGVVIGCAANQEVAISSTPYLQNNATDCSFHCNYEWSAPSGFDFRRDVVTGNPLESAQYMTFPSGLSNGYVGNLATTALYTACGSLPNTTTTTPIWYGPPGVPSENKSVQDSSLNNWQIVLTTYPVGVSCSWSIISGSGTFSLPYTSGDANTVTSAGGCVVRVTMTNTCGSTNHDITIPPAFGMRSAYPNPAKNVLTLEFGDTKAHVLPERIDLISENSAIPVKTILPLNFQNSKNFANSKKIEMDVDQLPRGTYYLHVKSKKSVQKTKILLE